MCLFEHGLLCPPPQVDEENEDDDDDSQDEDDESQDSDVDADDDNDHRHHRHQHYPTGDSRRARASNGSSRNPRLLESATYSCGRCDADHVQERLVWALRRTASRDFLRPGPCLDSPGMGWDGLDMDRLPPPVDQVSPRPGHGQRGRGGARGGGGRGGLQQPPTHEERKEEAPAGTAAGPAAPGDGDDAVVVSPSISAMFRMARQSRGGGKGAQNRSTGGSDGVNSAEVYRVTAGDGVRVRRGANPQSAEVTVLGKGTELVVVEELHDGNNEVWMRLSAPVEGWIGKRGSSLMALRGSLAAASGTVCGSVAGRGGGGQDRDSSDTGEAAEVALAKELEDCMEEEAGTELYRRDDRLFGSRQGWRLPSGGGSSLRVADGRGRGDANRRADSRVPGERRAIVVGHASVSGCWAAMASMSVASAKQKIASTAATLAVLHCRKILLTVLLQCHNEVVQTAAGGQAAADALLSQRVAALVGARDSPLPAMVAKASGEIAASPRASPAALRTRAASRQFSSFLQLVLFRGWHPGWWPLAFGGRWSEGDGAVEAGVGQRGDTEEEERGFLDDKEPMPECFCSLPVVITPVVLSLLRAAAAQRTATSKSSPMSAVGKGGPPAQLRSQSFGAHVEEALLQSVASQLRLATRIGHGDHACASSDAAEMSDSHCLRYPRLRYVNWAARVVQAGSGSPSVPRRIFHAWAAGLRSPSLPVKQQVCAELSRLLDEAVQVVDRVFRADVSAPASITAGDAGDEDRESIVGPDSATAVGSQRAAAIRRLSQCVELLPLERLRSLAERRMLKEGEDEPMLSRALQSIVDLVASAELASRVLQERQAETDEEQQKEKENDKATATSVPVAVAAAAEAAATAPAVQSTESGHPQPVGRSVLCFPSPTAYVSLQGRDLEPPWTAEFWLLRPNPDGTWDDGEEPTGKPVPTAPKDSARDGGIGAGEKKEASGTVRPLEPGPSMAPIIPRRGISKAFSERLPLPPPTVSMARASSTPSSSVDLTHLPPMDTSNGAPALTRARSVDAVGQDEADGLAGQLDRDDFPPLGPPSSSAAAAASAAGATRQSASASSQQGVRTGAAVAKGRGGGGGFQPSFSAAYASPMPSSSAGQTSGQSPWNLPLTLSIDGGSGTVSAGGKERRELGSAKEMDEAASTAAVAADVGGTERESMRKGETGTEPAEYLTSSQAGHIKLQAGGTVFSESVGQTKADGLAGKEEGEEEEGGGGDEGGNSVVHSEALCVSMGAAGVKERVFDFVVPTGHWVHVAIVASSVTEARTTLYVDGAAVDSMSMSMSLPMGCLGAGPHAQEASAAGSGGGSFVGLLAQTRYVMFPRSG